jgi:hypothetical protein
MTKAVKSGRMKDADFRLRALRNVSGRKSCASYALRAGDREANSLYIVNWVFQPNDNGPALFLHRVRLSDGKETSAPQKGLRLAAKLTDEHGNQKDDARGKPVILHPDQKQRAALLLVPLTDPHKTLFIRELQHAGVKDAHERIVRSDIPIRSLM